MISVMKDTVKITVEYLVWLCYIFTILPTLTLPMVVVTTILLVIVFHFLWLGFEAIRQKKRTQWPPLSFSEKVEEFLNTLVLRPYIPVSLWETREIAGLYFIDVFRIPMLVAVIVVYIIGV